MFDIAFTEMLFIGIVALFVIGPERMPEAVRTAATMLNRLRRSFNDIKREVKQELHNDAVLRDLRDSGKALREETENLRQQLSTPLEADAGGDAAQPTTAGEAPGQIDTADGAPGKVLESHD